MDKQQGLKRVLVAEDEKAYSRALVLKLKHAGFEAQSAGDGEEALAILKGGSFDLLILDLVMPKLNGFAVLEELQGLGIRLPVIVLSNLMQDEDKGKAQILGAQLFLEKSNSSLVDIISEVKKILSE